MYVPRDFEGVEVWNTGVGVFSHFRPGCWPSVRMFTDLSWGHVAVLSSLGQDDEEA